MNSKEVENSEGMTEEQSFRPQQGLTIMNEVTEVGCISKRPLFPSPTGVNYYESLPTKP